MNIFSEPSTAEPTPTQSEMSSTSASSSSSSNETQSNDYKIISHADLDSLLQQARNAAQNKKLKSKTSSKGKEKESTELNINEFEEGHDVVNLQDNESIPRIDPNLVTPAKPLKDDLKSGSKTAKTGSMEAKVDNLPQPKMSKKQKREASNAKKGASAHFNMPAQTVTPEMKREIQALRLHQAMDPKRFLRGEAKRENKKMPEYFQVGYIVDPGSRVSNAAQGKINKKSFVESLVEDEQAKAYAKKKYDESQQRNMSGTGGKWAKKRKRN